MDFDALRIRRMCELDRLPWFEKAGDRRIRLRPDAGLPPVIDVHSHLGWSQGFGRAINMSARTEHVDYFFDYEADQDLLNEESHPTPAERASFARDFMLVPIRTSRQRKTHTLANFAAEISLFNYRSVYVSPIEIPVCSRHATETAKACRLDNRFVPFAAVYPRPWGPKKEAHLDRLLAMGARGVKFHPEFQFTAPDEPHAMKLFEWCAAHDLPVLVHCGYGGSEPASMKRRAEPERYRAMLQAFPNLRVILGHTGLSVRTRTIEVAREFAEHAWVDVSGQAVPGIREILSKLDPTRILYGSDWPFYPLSVALARLLVATESQPDVRAAILHDNAVRLFGLDGQTG